jgi:hypothetical protein
MFPEIPELKKTILKSSDFGIVFSDLSDKTGN